MCGDSYFLLLFLFFDKVEPFLDKHMQLVEIIKNVNKT